MPNVSSIPDYHRERHRSPPVVSAQMDYPEEEDVIDTLPHEGEATPQYESDPESNYVGSRNYTQGRHRRSESSEDAVTWEMHSDEGMGNHSRRYHHRHGRDLEEQSSIGDGMNKYGHRKGKASDTGIIVIPRIPGVPVSSRHMGLDDPSASRPSSVIHPYVSGV